MQRIKGKWRFIYFIQGCNGYQITENKYYNFLTNDEIVAILNKLNIKMGVIEYFETLPCTKREQKGTIWGNLIIKKGN